MAVRKRGKTWVVDLSFTNRQGKAERIRQGGFKKKKDAEDYELEIKRKIKTGIELSTPDLSLYEYFEKYIRLYVEGKVAIATENKYRDTLKSIDKYFPFATLKKTSAEEYQEGLNEYAKTHAKGTTRKFHGQIRTAIKRAMMNRDIEYDFTQGAIISGAKDEKKTSEKYISEKDLNKLLRFVEEKFDPRYANSYMIYIAGLTGLRYGELLGLTWNDLDFDNHTIDINKAWDYKNTHGFTKNKTLFSPRKIKVTKKMIQVLDNYKMGQQEQLERLDKKNPFNLVFFNVFTGVPDNKGTNDRLKEYLQKLNISPLITFHGLRHTHASVLFRNKMSVPSISKRLGHKNTEITYSTYIHIIKEMEEDDSKLVIDILEKVGN